MGKYENKIAIESCIKTIHKQKCTEHKAQSMIDELEMAYDKAKAWDRIYANSVVHSITENVFIETGETKEIKEVYKKAKAFDEVRSFITKRLKEQELTDEYDFGERFICEEIEDIIGGKLNG